MRAISLTEARTVERAAEAIGENGKRKIKKMSKRVTEGTDIQVASKAPSEKQNPPVKTFRLGRIKAAVWAQELVQKYSD